MTTQKGKMTDFRGGPVSVTVLMMLMNVSAVSSDNDVRLVRKKPDAFVQYFLTMITFLTTMSTNRTTKYACDNVDTGFCDLAFRISGRDMWSERLDQTKEVK